MRQRRKRLVFSFLALFIATLFTSRVEARHTRGHAHRIAHYAHNAGRHHHVIQCVAFVHQSTDFHIHGNARDWWNRAAGRYARGNTPEEGSVLSFRSTRRIPLGHVAVVRSILDSRTIFIDQSHWASNGISRNVRVVDVSPRNNWTAVRVALNGHKDHLGSIYPTNGFIYHRSVNSAHATQKNASFLVQDEHNTGSIETASALSAKEFFDDDAPNRSIQ